MTSAYEWIITTRSFHRTRIELLSAACYRPPPPELEAPHLLLNIRNRQDHNCFLYCFTAAWHLKHGPLLYVASRDSIGRRTSPETYFPRNHLAHQAVGDCEMPMAFGQMLQFEKLNKCNGGSSFSNTEGSCSKDGFSSVH